MENNRWHLIGDSRVIKVPDMMLTALSPEKLLPDWTDEQSNLICPWLSNTLDNTRNHVLLSVHSWLVEDRGRKILIDTGAGNAKKRPLAPYFDQIHTAYLENLSQIGIRPEDIDFVLLTHLHVDHVGWNTRDQDGKWIPTFPNARYLFSWEEYKFFSDPFNNCQRNHTSFSTRVDSVDPIVDAGLADLIKVDGREVIEGFSFHSTPGHTAHHAVILFRSGTEQALFTGDVMHHPLQAIHPEWRSVFDADPQAAVAARRWVLDYAHNNGATLFTSHFPLSSAGRVQENDEGYGWYFL